MRSIVLLTDFGLSDHYVGVLHAVLERDAPGAARIDLGHELSAGDIWQACYLLRCSWPHLPPQAVVLAVVDPGVGTERRAVAVKVGDRRLVAPDNGLAGSIAPADEVVLLDRQRMELPEPSHTFHGRDLFAPAAARLAGGDALASGTSIDSATWSRICLRDTCRRPRWSPVATAAAPAGWRPLRRVRQGR
jgi:S-adenosylmethionine hydrolase